jgi:hypothetical protein
MCGGVYEEEFMTLEKLETMLNSHDWFYDFSDDHRAWERGRSQRVEIEEAIATLTVQGFRKEAVSLYNETKPDGFYDKE